LLVVVMVTPGGNLVVFRDSKGLEGLCR
jgi:hypothetical protein